mmetsp:Transcript_143625/g.253661  ORF Transcript_143625/g.253661 Transcript_143625/m.253661 type:complete len:217 (-) Transcript_143625:646-1296(-)
MAKSPTARECHYWLGLPKVVLTQVRLPQSCGKNGLLLFVKSISSIVRKQLIMFGRCAQIKAGNLGCLVSLSQARPVKRLHSRCILGRLIFRCLPPSNHQIPVFRSTPKQSASGLCGEFWLHRRIRLPRFANWSPLQSPRTLMILLAGICSWMISQSQSGALVQYCHCSFKPCLSAWSQADGSLNRQQSCKHALCLDDKIYQSRRLCRMKPWSRIQS